MTPGICLLVDQAVRAFVPALAFTLAWTHSIEKTEWREDYRAVDGGFVITEASVAGSGAGMEPPAGARLRDGAWYYTPPPRVHPRLRLTISPYAGEYRFCAQGRCRPLREMALVESGTAVVEVSRCAVVLTSPPASR